MNEEEFYASYKKTSYPRPSVTADTVLFRIRGKLELLLIQRGGYPFKGSWALPGGFVEVGDAFEDQGEDLPQAAARELEEETGIAGVELRQLAAFGRPYRDRRTRIITIAYYGIAAPDVEPCASDDAASAGWFPVSTLPELAFDHEEIVRAAIARMSEDLILGKIPSKVDLGLLKDLLGS